MYLIDTDQFSMNSDELHFDAAGQVALGEAFGDSYLGTVPEPGTATVFIALMAATMLPRRGAGENTLRLTQRK